MDARMPFAFGALMAGAVVIDYGVKNAKTAIQTGASNASAAASSATAGVGSILASLFPAGMPLTVGRQDAGRDMEGKPGSPILAPGNGTVIAVPSNPGGFGDAYPVIHFITGPWAGLDVYFGHVQSLLGVGQSVSVGQSIATLQNGTGPYVGNASGIPGHTEIGLWGPNGPLNNGQLPPGL